MPSFSNPKTSYNILLVIGTLTILPFLFLNLYNNPVMDDYTFAIRDREIDFLDAQVQFYLNWSGRYFSTLTGRLNPLIHFDFVVYKLYSFAVLLLFLIAVIVFFYSLLKSYLPKKSILALAALILTILLVQMPDVAQGIYWFSAYMAYLVPNILILFLLTLLLWMRPFQDNISGKILKCIGLLLIVAIVGSNELSLLILMSSLLLILLTAWSNRNRQLPRYILFFFLFGFVLSLIVVLAPGNYVRMDGQEKSAHLLYSLAGSTFLTLSSFLKWGFLLLLSSLLYTYLWGLQLAKKTKDSIIFKCSLPLAFLWYLSTIFTMQFIFIWSTGFRAGTRVENVIHFFFVFGWFYILQLILNKYTSMHSGSSIIGSATYPLVLIAMFGMLVFNLESNATTAYLDLLSGKAAMFDKELNTRYEYLKTSSCTSCPINPVTALPKSLYIFSNLRPDEVEEIGINNEFAAYWGKRNTNLTGPTPTIPDNITILKRMGKDLRSHYFGIDE